MIVAWLVAFVFTQVVEIPIYRAMLHVSRPTAFGASAITHPFVWFVFPLLRMRFSFVTAFSELFAWLVEAAWFVLVTRRTLRIGLGRALFVSFVANAASEGLGLLSRHWFGWP